MTLEKKQAEKISSYFKEFCEEHDIKRGFTYLANDDAVYMINNDASDDELLKLIPHMVDYLAHKNDIRSAEIWLALFKAANEHVFLIPDKDLN